MSRRPQIYWRERGHGPALVLVNGWSASGLAWPGDWLRTLSRDHRVICPDSRGTGWSRHAETPFTVGDLAEDLVDVLDDAEVEHATVLGLSMGGMVAAELAIRAPERVDGLVLTATRGPDPSRRPLMAPAVAWQLLRPVGRGESLEHYFRSLWSSATAPGFEERHPERLDELVAQCLERPTPRALTTHQLRAASGWGRARRMARIAAPAIIVHGDADPLVDVRHARRLAELVPGAEYRELEDVGHLTPHEAPDELLDAVRSVAGHLAGAGR